MKALTMILAILLFSSITTTAQTWNNPDKYTSITIGAGANATYNTYTSIMFEDVEWKRYTEVPMLYGQVIIPVLDEFSLIGNYYYQFNYRSYFDGHSTNKSLPQNFTKKKYGYSVAVKIYIK